MIFHGRYTVRGTIPKGKVCNQINQRRCREAQLIITEVKWFLLWLYSVRDSTNTSALPSVTRRTIRSRNAWRETEISLRLTRTNKQNHTRKPSNVSWVDDSRKCGRKYFPLRVYLHNSYVKTHVSAHTYVHGRTRELGEMTPSKRILRTWYSKKCDMSNNRIKLLRDRLTCEFQQ